jgi:hypothetical protein
MRRLLAIAGAVAVAWAYAAAGLPGAAGACVGVIGVLYVAWRVDLKLYPNRSSCWFCKGKGRMPGSRTERHGWCPFCHGKPRLRRGAKEQK